MQVMTSQFCCAVIMVKFSFNGVKIKCIGRKTRNRFVRLIYQFRVIWENYNQIAPVCSFS